MSKLTREFFIPEGAEKREHPELSAIIYIAKKYGGYHAVCFGGRRTRPDLNYLYGTREQMKHSINDWLDGLKCQQIERERRKAERKKRGPAEPARSARILKGYLREFFPETKFSVQSKSFSGGSDIRVRYTDGPLYKEVSSIANLFQQGYFDGMTDTYTRVPIKVSCAGAKYVFVDRELSSEYQGKLLPILQEHHAPHYRGDGIERYARWQIGEAELLLHGIAYEEMEQRISERINAVLALETIAQ